VDCDKTHQGSKRAARPSPAQQNILSGRAGSFVKLTGPGGPDVLSGWPGPTILSFLFLFHQLFRFLWMIEIIRNVFWRKTTDFNGDNIMNSINFLN
jgi:hypothetical protein